MSTIFSGLLPDQDMLPKNSQLPIGTHIYIAAFGMSFSVAYVLHR